MSKPNIILLMFDALSAEDINKHADNLPHLTKLLQNSLTYRNCYAPSPQSGPARASLFTGLDMAAHGVWSDNIALPPHEVTLPEQFSKAGYATWLVGRRQLARTSHWTTEQFRPYEYDHLSWAHGPLHRSRQNAYLDWLSERAPAHYQEIFPEQPNADNTDIPPPVRAALRALPDELCFHSWVGAQISHRLSSHTGNQPFFGVAGLVSGDDMGAPRDNGGSEVSEYIDPQALKQADELVGELMKEFASIPNNIILMTAARGTKASPEAHHMQDRSLHVPLAIYGTNRPAQDYSDIVSTIDIAPTLYELGQVKPPPRQQGVSVLSGNMRGWAFARLRHPKLAHQSALTYGRYKLIMNHAAGIADCYSLYDRDTDPDEADDLAQNPDHRDTLTDMVDIMIDARVALEDRTEPRIALF